jgi:hypothetical protein
MKALLLAPLALGALVVSANATTYNGNGSADFGGVVGTGSLTLTDNGTTISGTVTRGAGNFNDVYVIFISSTAGGFSDTSGFTDAGDDLRRAISGYDGGNRSTLTFASGFTADYAIALGPDGENFGGLWQLAAGSSHGFVDSVSLSPTGTPSASSYSFSFDLSEIGLLANSGQSFDFLGTYISNSGYRSLEALGGNLSGTQGWNPFTQLSFDTYTTVPEPTAFSLLALGAAGIFLHRRRR